MADLTELVARLRGTPLYEAWGEKSATPKAAADAIEALSRENAALTARTEEAERACNWWRNDYRALEKAIVGDTGLSAMLIATQARLFKPRAEAAEAKVARLVEAVKEARNEAHSIAHSEFDGVWLSEDFDALTPLADAALREIGGQQ